MVDTETSRILASGMNNEAGYVGEKDGRGRVEAKPSFSLQFGLDLIPLVQEVLPSACLIGWIPVVMLPKDDSVWFPQKTC